MQIPHNRIIAIGWLLLGFLLSEGNALGQAPGYLGRHHLFKANMSFSPALGLGRRSGQPLRLNLQYSLQYEWVWGYRLSGILGATYVQSRYTYDYPVNGQQIIGNYLMRGATLDLGLRYYTHRRYGNIAPLGPFHQLQMRFLRYRTEDLDMNFNPDGSVNLGYFNDLMIAYSFGTQRFLNDHFGWSASISGGWLFGIPARGNLTEGRAYIRDRSIRRWRGYFALNLVASLGLILF